MYKKKKILTIIQARGGSKGIPKKNIYPICGHPLIAYTIFAVKKSKYVDDLIVSTDNYEIAKKAKKYGAEVPFIRPKSLSGDFISSKESLRYAYKKICEVKKEKYDLVIEAPCVAPFRTSKDIDRAIEIFFNNKNTDTVIGLCNTGEKHPIRIKKITNNRIYDFCKEFPEPLKGSFRQNLKPSYIRNGSIYCWSIKALFDNKSRHGKISRPYVMPFARSFNIDEIYDLKICEILIKNNMCMNKPKIILNEIKHNQKRKKKY